MIKDKIHNVTNLAYLAIAHILILLGYAVNKALFHNQTQLWLLFLGWVFLLILFWQKKSVVFNFSLSAEKILILTGLVSFGLFYIFDGGIDLWSKQAYINIVKLKFLALGLFMLYLVEFNFSHHGTLSVLLKHLQKNKFWYLVIVALIINLTTIFYSPIPKIDVYWVFDGGAQSVIEGQNPYAATFYNPYSPQACDKLYGTSDCENKFYSYLTTALVATTASKWLFGDIRFAFIASIFGMGLIIFLLLKERFKENRQPMELLILLLLYLPLGNYVLEQSWVESLAGLVFYLFVYLALSGYRYWPYLIFGLFLATKQTMWIFIPFVLKFQGLNYKKVLLSLVTFLVLTLPFLFWGAADYWEDIFLNQWHYRDALHSLSFNTLNKLFFYDLIHYNFWYLGFLSGLFIWLWWKTKRDWQSIIQAVVVLMMALFIVKRGFANYYYGISLFIILLMTLELRKINSNFDDHQRSIG
ncbi:MAG: hypothetical protein RB292_00165 [Patescibacteria group bacterium]|jgi:hypothetical protein|nr:hypothetical protein [Patescibacteria group bacterium]